MSLSNCPSRSISGAQPGFRPVLALHEHRILDKLPADDILVNEVSVPGLHVVAISHHITTIRKRESQLVISIQTDRTSSHHTTRCVMSSSRRVGTHISSIVNPSS
jgi:hypothetical protein